MKEIWKPIRGWKFYEVSNMGRVRSLVRRVWTGHHFRRVGGRILESSQLYPRVNLRADFKSAHFYVHILVLTTFVGPCPSGKECRHLNGIESDARLSNLAWGTHLENESDKLRHNTLARGEHHYFSKLTDALVRRMRRLRAKKGLLWKDIAKMFGVSPDAARQAGVGASWKHIPMEPVQKPALVTTAA